MISRTGIWTHDEMVVIGQPIFQMKARACRVCNRGPVNFCACSEETRKRKTAEKELETKLEKITAILNDDSYLELED